MKRFIFYRPTIRRQLAISIAVVVGVSIVGFLLQNLVGYRVVAFMLLVVVSILAMTFDITPVLASATISALIWDFFFIPPRFTLTVGTSEDRILLLMYF